MVTENNLDACLFEYFIVGDEGVANGFPELIAGDELLQVVLCFEH